jgi:hypothetical protein
VGGLGFFAKGKFLLRNEPQNPSHITLYFYIFHKQDYETRTLQTARKHYTGYGSGSAMLRAFFGVRECASRASSRESSVSLRHRGSVGWAKASAGRHVAGALHIAGALQMRLCSGSAAPLGRDRVEMHALSLVAPLFLLYGACAGARGHGHGRDDAELGLELGVARRVHPQGSRDERGELAAHALRRAVRGAGRGVRGEG